MRFVFSMVLVLATGCAVEGEVYEGPDRESSQAKLLYSFNLRNIEICDNNVDDDGDGQIDEDDRDCQGKTTRIGFAGTAEGEGIRPEDYAILRGYDGVVIVLLDSTGYNVDVYSEQGGLLSQVTSDAPIDWVGVGENRSGSHLIIASLDGDLAGSMPMFESGYGTLAYPEVDLRNIDVSTFSVRR